MIFLEYVGSRASLSAKLKAARRQRQAKSCKVKHLQDFFFFGVWLKTALKRL